MIITIFIIIIIILIIIATIISIVINAIIDIFMIRRRCSAASEEKSPQKTNNQAKWGKQTEQN